MGWEEGLTIDLFVAFGDEGVIDFVCKGLRRLAEESE